MANDVGYIRPECIPALKTYLDRRGIGWNPGHGQWEVIRIAYGGHTCVVTRNQKEQYKTPVELRPLLLDFRDFMLMQEPTLETNEEITDTERLDFMLSKGRQVITEVEGWGSEGRHYAVYVEEGTMADRKYDAVRFTAEDHSSRSPEGLKIKREAIDLAIIQSRGESSD